MSVALRIIWILHFLSQLNPGRLVLVMLVEYPLTELPKVLRRRELLVDVRLHEERERLTRDLARIVARGADAHAVRGRAELAGGGELEGLPCLEGEAVGGDRNFGKCAAAGANIKPRRRGGRLDGDGFSCGLAT